MEYRSLSVVALLIALGIPAGSAWAERAPDPEQQADWQRRLDKAEALQSQAKVAQEAADKAYGEKEKLCYKKFLVNACRDEAAAENTRLTREARRIENEGKALERQVRKEQLSDKDARYIADADVRAADLQARQTATAAVQAAAAASAETERANKEQRAAEGARRRAEAAEKHAKKVADHQAKVARQMEKSRQQDAAAEVR